MKECRLIKIDYSHGNGNTMETVGGCKITEYPDIDKDLNLLLNDGWTIKPVEVSPGIGIAVFYIERERKTE